MTVLLDSEPIPTPSISELAEALHVSIPQLELYSWVAKDLQTWIANSKQIYAQAEAEVAEVVPLLFREFSVTNEEERATLLVSFPGTQCILSCLTKSATASIKIDQGK